MADMFDFSGLLFEDESVSNLQLPDPSLLGYYVDSKERIFYLDDEIDDETTQLSKTILRINQEDKGIEPEKRRPIRIFINSIGGDVQVLWSLINVMLLSKTPIHTIAYCNALSAAAILLIAGHKRYAIPGSAILIHSGSCSLNGDVEKVESAKRFYDNLSKKVNAFILERTNISEKELKKKSSSDWYLTAEEALNYHIVDKLVDDLDEII